MFLKLKLFFACLLLSIIVKAQEQSVELSTVTVTSTIVPTVASKTGRNIVTFKGEDFAKLPVNSIDELLKYIPGVEVQSRGPMGTQSDFVIRGGTFQQVLVIVNGLRVNDPNSGHFTSNIPVTPSQIERIEVLKGPSSAVYGSDAVGGVINIITKAFSSRTEEKKEVTGQITSGAYGLLNGAAGGFYSKGNTRLDAGILSNNADGQEQRGVNGFFHNNTLSAGITQRTSNSWQLGFRSSYDSRKFGAQNFYTTALADTANEKVTTFWNQLRISHQGSNDKFSLHAGYKSLYDTYQYNGASTANKSHSTLLQLLALYEKTLSTRSTLVGGLQFQDRGIDSNDRGNHAVRQAAAFVILQQSVGSAFTISPAARIDWDERSGAEFIPQLNVSYLTGDFQFRGSAGKTIRQADFTERYNNYNKSIVLSGRIGNPSLAAEHSFSYEAGADWFANSHLKIATTLFQQNYDKLIDYVSTPYSEMPRQSNLSPQGNYLLARNISTVTTSGAELDVQYQHQLENGHRLFATAGLIWLKSESPAGTPSLYLSNHAKLMSNITAGFSTARFSVSITGIYKDRAVQKAQPIDASLTEDYFLLNAKAEYFIYRDHLSVFAQIDNLFDTRYSDLLGAIMPRRWIMGGLKFRI